MRRTLTLASCATLLALTGCASTAKPAAVATPAAPAAATATTAPAKATTPLTATTAMTQLAAKITTAKLTNVVTENNDGNNLIGRPHEYTSKVQFKDTRVNPADTTGLDKGDIQFGGSIEVFATPEDATARAKYIQAVTASLPAAAEYDYVQGDVLVRVSHLLKPSQAKEYEAATRQLG
jgi:hypothetical protein